MEDAFWEKRLPQEAHRRRTKSPYLLVFTKRTNRQSDTRHKNVEEVQEGAMSLGVPL